MARNAVLEEIRQYRNGTLIQPKWLDNPVRSALLQLIPDGPHLSYDQANEVMDEVGRFYTTGESNATLEQIVTLYAILRVMDVPAETLAGLAAGVMRWQNRVDLRAGNAICTSGMGGDRFKTVNVSSPSSVISSAAGARIAKHGARAVTGRTGSTDWFEAAGVDLHADTSVMAQACDEIGIGFFEFTRYNNVGLLAFKVMASNLFEYLGPLANPCEIHGHVCGATSTANQDLLGKSFQLMIHKGVLPEDFRALIPCGLDDDGQGVIDEVSSFGPTRIVEASREAVRAYTIEPEDLGIQRSTREGVAARPSAAENLSATIRVVQGEGNGPIRDILVMNAAAHLYVAGVAPTLKDGVPMAQEAIESGAAQRKMEELARATGR